MSRRFLITVAAALVLIKFSDGVSWIAHPQPIVRFWQAHIMKSHNGAAQFQPLLRRWPSGMHAEQAACPSPE